MNIMVVEKQTKEGENMQKCNSDVIRKQIELLLLKQEKTRANLAEWVGFDESTLSKKMNGYVDWKLNECISVADFFNMPISEIFLST